MDALLRSFSDGTFWVGIATLAGIYALLAMSLNVICGVTGLLQLGHAGFFAVGAYTAALVSMYATVPALGGVNLLIGCGAAMVAAAVFALLIGLPCLRLRGDYLAIATLGFGEIIRLVLRNIRFPGCAVTGGEPFGESTGVVMPSRLWYDLGEVYGPEHADYAVDYAEPWVIWLVLVLSYAFFVNLKRSALGRAMMCIREDEIAARAMGVNIPRKKVYAFLLSAVFAGLAGALMAHNASYGLTVSPDQFTLLTTIQVLLMVVLGGLGSFTGSLLAALILVFAPAMLRFVPDIAGVSLSDKQQLLYAMLLIVLIRMAPNGLLGSREQPEWMTRLLRRRISP